MIRPMSHRPECEVCHSGLTESQAMDALDRTGRFLCAKCERPHYRAQAHTLYAGDES